MVNVGLPTADVPNRGWHLWIVGTVMLIVSVFFVGVRLVARYFRGGIKMDDWTILASLTCCLMFTVSHDIAVHNGYGRHDTDITRPGKRNALKGIFVSQVLYKLVLCLTKVSILLLYLRVFSVARRFSWCCIGMIIFTVISSVAYVCSTIWQCRPVGAFWDRSKPHVCTSNHISWLSYAVINITTDFVILFLPVQQILRLQLKLRDKICVIMIFMLGGFVCITSIIRTKFLAASANLKDVTWNTIPTSTWSAIEINTGIVCACLPMIRQPLSILFPNLFSMSDRSSSRPYELSYANNSRHKSRGERSLPTVNPNLGWTRDHGDHVFMASVKPGGSRAGDAGYIRRTESEENILNREPMDGGIMKTMDVSISELPRAGFAPTSSSSHDGKNFR